MGSQMKKSADQPRAQWYWKSNSDSWSTNEQEEWTKYSDIESAIIEEAFNGTNKTKLADLDNYLINLNESIQISKSDPNRQRQIKRVPISRNETQGLREQRFFLPPGLSKTFNTDKGEGAYNFLSQWKKDKKLSNAEIVKQAAKGIITEGKQLDKHYESHYIARQLLAVRKKDRKEIYTCCIQLYTMECFLYKLINKALRENDTSKTSTLGPFCYILFRSWLTTEEKHTATLYRGVNIDDNQLTSYQEAIGQTRCWDGFTSTTKNHEKAQMFGNILFVIDATHNGGIDISALSDYDEEEVLLPPGTSFIINKVDPTEPHTLIYLQLLDLYGGGYGGPGGYGGRGDYGYRFYVLGGYFGPGGGGPDYDVL
ncbi:unnamed protein product [Didymodactylos carnosus]|uniref:NAD(P)(+)--arginine ADP-ribosyltransferase n=1 Tax=Didymodactylos carnosus TaxID=1234261 RepID=A0A8S2FHC1_9BILA|nr:unnamed protein product [Didymodactylos carnosus]CAF4261552.1 unnamed protein product [Didymodactylos carnosus]